MLYAYSLKKSICCWLWRLSRYKISKYLPVLLKETICIKHTRWHIVDAQNMLITFLHSCCHCDLKITLQKICFLIRIFIMIFYYILFNSKTITFKTSVFSYVRCLNSSVVRTVFGTRMLFFVAF